MEISKSQTKWDRATTSAASYTQTQMVLKTSGEAPGNDKLQPDKYQRTDAKSPDKVEANKARTEAKMEIKPKAKARGDTIKEGLEEAIDAAGSSTIYRTADEIQNLDIFPNYCLLGLSNKFQSKNFHGKPVCPLDSQCKTTPLPLEPKGVLRPQSPTSEIQGFQDRRSWSNAFDWLPTDQTLEEKLKTPPTKIVCKLSPKEDKNAFFVWKNSLRAIGRLAMEIYSEKKEQT
uniref:Uncharacterized protein n=1 Tax=Romanomermis culicivorax TaxID=13658 RepID=A0A915JRQ1_ROMCU